jgi:hypothetical protein
MRRSERKAGSQGQRDSNVRMFTLYILEHEKAMKVFEEGKCYMIRKINDVLIN